MIDVVVKAFYKVIPHSNQPLLIDELADFILDDSLRHIPFLGNVLNDIRANKITLLNGILVFLI